MDDLRTSQGLAPGVALPPQALDCLMPMHLLLSDDARIVSLGPTLSKICDPREHLGRLVFDVFEFRAAALVDAVSLRAAAGLRLRLNLRVPQVTGVKGLVVPLDGGRGMLMNLSLGLSVAEAVRDHALTDTDFAATDLAVELLYLIEAKTAVLEELRNLNTRLNGARRIAEEQALTDTLTGLRNRRALMQVLDTLILAGRPFGLMHLDLDYFKDVNDTHGHAAGDHVLIEIGRILTQETRAGDTIARIGGDEFVLVFPGVQDYGPLTTIAHRILDRVKRPIAFDGRQCHVSGSIGAVLSILYEDPRPDPIVAAADAALYGSKRRGRGRITTVDPAELDGSG